MKERDGAASAQSESSAAPNSNIPFVATVPVEPEEFRRFSEPEQLTDLAHRLIMEAVQYVRFATLLFPAGGWRRDHAVVVGNIARLSKLLQSIAWLTRDNLVDMVVFVGCQAIEAMVDIRYLCENFSVDVVNDYVQNSSHIISTDGRWGGLDRLQRADAVGLRRTVFFDLTDAPLHIHGTWKTVIRFHLDETQDGNYLPNLKGNTTHPQALLSLSMLSLETILSFMQSIDRSDRVADLEGAIRDLCRRLTKADELSGAWFNGLQTPA